MELLNWVVSNYGTISLVVVFIFGLIVKIRSYIKHAINAIIIGHHFGRVFGQTPAETIKEIHETIQTAHDILQIRQQISERYLKIGVYMCDLEGRCVWTNDYINEMFGLDSTDMRGFGWLTGIHTSDRKRVFDEWIHAVKNNMGYSYEYTICNVRDEVSLLVKTTAVCVIDDNNEKKCYIGYLQIKNSKPLECNFSK